MPAPPPPPPPPRTPPPPQPPQAPRPRNARTARKAPHGVLEVDWPFFGEMCRALALKIFREYDPDVVIGIARAGVIPGAVVASILQRDFASMAITRTETGGRPVVIAGPTRLVTGRRGLIVEDRKSTRLNSSHLVISYAVFCLKKKKTNKCSRH